MKHEAVGSFLILGVFLEKPRLKNSSSTAPWLMDKMASFACIYILFVCIRVSFAYFLVSFVYTKVSFWTHFVDYTTVWQKDCNPAAKEPRVSTKCFGTQDL